MNILLDHCVPARLGALLGGHGVRTARLEAWDDLGNGRPLSATAEAGFGALITLDRGIRHQQNVKVLPVLVVLVLTRVRGLTYCGSVCRAF